MRTIQKDRQNIWIFMCMILGVIAIVVGVIFLFGFKGEVFYGSANSISGGISHLGTSEFGADFYTEIYESTTFAANALVGVYEMISTCFGVFMMFLGLVDICAFGSKLVLQRRNGVNSEETKAVTNLVEQ